ncbi:MAG: HPr(Ser) kinase/phosphatase [candidate division KSB1 bacterium]|nr:HPr(Ser) kinase/phosphatase [candidate division KSB1 bacterium]
MSKLTVRTLYEDNRDRLQLSVVNGEYSFERVITEPDLHRPGLALAGFTEVFTYQRIQIVGNTESRYLERLSPGERESILEKVLSFAIPCIIVTDNNPVAPEFERIASEKGITLFRTPVNTTQLMQLLSEYLDDRFAPRLMVHGTLVDVYGIGVLITGRSAIGKSEVALDLVERGHRLVADDVVHIVRKADGVLMGTASDLLQQHMEIRGLGIIDVRALFGIRAVRMQKRVEVEVHLEEWDSSQDYERLGLDEHYTEYLGVKIPIVRLPIFPGKNVTVIVEVIALNQLLKIYGTDSAKEFSQKLMRLIQTRRAYLTGDLE